MMKAPMARIDEPDAKPSRPSARLTAFVVAVTMTMIHTQNSTMPMTVPSAMKSSPVSRTTLISVEAGVSPFSSGKLMAKSAKAVAMTTCPTIFHQPLRPRLRCLWVLMKSSINPTVPSPTMSMSTRRGDNSIDEPVIQLEAKYPTMTARTMTMPPIVGVPFFQW